MEFQIGMLNISWSGKIQKNSSKYYANLNDRGKMRTEIIKNDI